MSSAEKVGKGRIIGLAVIAAAVGVVAAACIVAAGVAAGIAVAGGPAAVTAGAAAMGAVGGIALAGATGGLTLAIKNSGSAFAGAIATIALGAATFGGGLAGFEIGKSMQETKNGHDAAVSISVGKDLRKAFDAHPDKGRVVNEINEFVTEKLRKERGKTFNLCVNNPDYFKTTGVDCAIYKPSAPAP